LNDFLRPPASRFRDTDVFWLLPLMPPFSYFRFSPWHYIIHIFITPPVAFDILRWLSLFSLPSAATPLIFH